jgi:predicted dehydrogenase
VRPAAVGLCGLGSAALRAHLPALCRAEETGAAIIAGVCDPDPARSEMVVARTLRARPFADATALLDGCGCDLLVIASPPSAHLPEIAAAAERGVDVLCEKPLGLAAADVAELRRLVDADPSWLVATVHQYSHAPAWRVIERWLRGPAAAGAPFTVEVEVERPGTDPLSAGGWRALGREGGILGDHAVHYLALCRRLDPRTRVVGAHRRGAPGRESAAVALVVGPGRARIAVSYAGSHRRNLVAAGLPDRGAELRWEDGGLVVATGPHGAGRCHPTGALSDRQFVNDLYGALYDDLLSRRDSASWRRHQRTETVEVAALLADALSISAAP